MALNLTTLKAGSAAVRLVPYGPLVAAAQWAGERLVQVRPGVAEALGRNLSAVIGPERAAGAAQTGIGSYARYWVEALRLPTMSLAQVDRRFGFTNYHHILDVQAAGFGPILVLPHLGQWEWAAAWLGRVDNSPVAAVVERLEPEEVFEWFVAMRSSFDVNVIPLGSDAIGQLVAAQKQRQTTCLLADRDVQGNGIAVDFFGHEATLPVGPAVLSCRTGAPLLPTAVFYRGDYIHCEVGEPQWPETEGRLRDRVRRMTQQVSASLEDLIREAPEQWHVLSPVWASTPA